MTANIFGLPFIESRKPPMKKAEELVVITKTYDLILWSCNHTRRFPRQHRFVLCSTWEQAVESDNVT